MTTHVQRDPVKSYGVGTLAFLDSREGLIPCVVKAIDGRRITVVFTDEPHHHWSGMTKNVWRGRTETFSSTMIVPRKAVRNGRIGFYRWES
jgi:phospholipase C